MVALLAALVGFAVLDSLDVLVVGITAAISVQARVSRRSPFRAGSAFLAGIFTATSLFGLLTVLGIDFVTGLFDFTLTPAVRYRTQVIVGVALLALAFVRSRPRPTPAWATRLGSNLWIVGLAGAVIGLVQGPTGVPYLAGLAMLSAHEPRPAWWPAIVIVYCTIALLPPVLVLFLASRTSPRSRRAFATTVRTLMRYGPTAVRIIFVILGLVLIGDAVTHAHHLVPGRT